MTIRFSGLVLCNGSTAKKIWFVAGKPIQPRQHVSLCLRRCRMSCCWIFISETVTG
jgi:hypothetical protein